MKISILIPSYNSETYIERALHSILENGYSDFEVLIMDNLSTDSTAEKVSNIADPRIKLIAQKDTGMYDALNRGIQSAAGEIVCWLGADDQFTKGSLQATVDVYSSNPVAQWTAGDTTFLYEGSWAAHEKQYYLPEKVTFQDIVSGNPLVSPSITFRKELFLQVGGFNERYKYAGDYDLWIKFARVANPVLIAKVLSIFSYNGANASSKRKIEMYNETLAILATIPEKELRFAKFRNSFRLHIYIFINMLRQRKWQTQ